MDAKIDFSELANAQLHNALANVRHLKMVDNHRAHLRVKGRSAQVMFEPGDWISTSLVVGDPPAPTHAIQVNHSLPGNVRFALDSNQAVLVAETRTNGVAHLGRTFDDIRYGLAQALRVRIGRRQALAPPQLDKVESLLDELQGNDQPVVKLDDGWELHPRVRGTTLPVRATLTDEGLRFHRTLLKSLPQGVAREAVLDQALRFNRQVRLARLAVVNESLVVESQLHQQQMSACWFREAATAVAVASQHTQSVLQVLTDHEDVARTYVLTICPSASRVHKQPVKTLEVVL